jgi:hypothetical protein
MRPRDIKIVGYVMIGILVLNLALFSFRVINSTFFWAIIVFGAVVNYLVLPRLKGR